MLVSDPIKRSPSVDFCWLMTLDVLCKYFHQNCFLVVYVSKFCCTFGIMFIDDGRMFGAEICIKNLSNERYIPIGHAWFKLIFLACFSHSKLLCWQLVGSTVCWHDVHFHLA